MQAVHGAVTSTPPSDSSSINGPSAIPKYTRYSSSRSNSFSSASIVTVKRTASLSSSTGTGARNSTAPMRAQSPVDASLITLRVGREQLSHDQKRRKSVAVDPTERPISDGLGNSHRYSHSTSSSVASAGNTKRNRASSSALAGALTGQGFSPKKRSAGTIDYSPRASLQRPSVSHSSSSRAQRSPATSPERERRRPSRPELTNPLNSLPSLHTTPGLTNDTESPSTTQTVATPTTQTSYGPDYFWYDSASPQNTSKGQKPVMTRAHTAPAPAIDPLRIQAVEGAHYTDTVDRHLDHQNNGGGDAQSRSKGIEMQEEPSNLASGNENSRQKPRARERGEKDKKSMLAKALQKANTAVLLDNAQNFEGALEAYTDACNLLQQVTERSSGADDKRKLNAIKYTYTTRIEELRQMELAQPDVSTEKSLPARPTSNESLALSPGLASPTIDSTIRDTSVTQRVISADRPMVVRTQEDQQSLNRSAVSTVRGSNDEEPLPFEPLFDEAETSWDQVPGPRVTVESEGVLQAGGQTYADGSSTSKVPTIRTNILHIPPSQNEKYMPAPLSPQRKYSPQHENEIPQTWSEERELVLPRGEQQILREGNDNNIGSSWLDTIDESSSRTSSVHSISSQQGVRRKYLRGVSGVSSNADFDAAFDAAVEAAYDQGLEPDMRMAQRRRGPRTKRETNESIPVRSSEIEEISSLNLKSRLYEDYNSSAEEEEDRMLDDIAQDYAQSFNFDISNKSALPRQSGSSGYSRSTWQSSQVSDRTTAGTSLSTVAEDVLHHPTSKNAFAASPPLSNPLAQPIAPPPPPPLTAPPPQTSLPKLPVAIQQRTSSVRNRRLSGPNMKKLKIETPVSSDVRKRASTAQSSSPVKEREARQTQISEDFDFGTSFQPLTASDTQDDDILNSPPSLNIPSASALSDNSRPMTAPTPEQRPSLEEDPGELRMYKPTFAKNKSSDGVREHMVLLASPTVENGPSMYTPLSSTFMNFSSKRMNETPLTSQRANLPSFGGSAVGSSLQGAFLFDTSLSDAQMSTPKSPTVPVGVEPCPDSFLLRPFWLMRNLALTLTHPKGGFLTSRLFVPREVWQIKSMKLKYLEDKIANCDLLTAALGRLAGVDTYDADAVMEELESFEDVLERVQNTLAKKLGGEVGTGGLNSMFKEASAGNTLPSNASIAPDASLGAEKVKGYLSSWRKLRQKSSGAPATGALANKSSSKNTEKEALNMSTVPMTGIVSLDRRFNKKDTRNLVFEGPNKDYMSSLAKLFEGVQVLDQIARQVEDPGLRGTSQTHVGLELSIRHAAEFFSFYICRFVLVDLGILIDKYVKRGTEWVLA